MKRSFNVTGACDPQLHYMVDIRNRLSEIKELVDQGAYFTINRARQYGKTTTLNALKKYLSNEYVVLSTDFQLFSNASFENEYRFAKDFSDELLFTQNIPDKIRAQLEVFAAEGDRQCDLRRLFRCLSDWCAISEKPIVLMIDEVDSATNNQVFLDFLAQLRGYYIHREERSAFQSAILAGVYDVKNLRRKIRSDDEHKVNSPWNIAADFNIDMSFSKSEIADMIWKYENDYHTGMDIDMMAGLIFDYTSGYPFLVSKICKLMDEKICRKDKEDLERKRWTKNGFDEAIRMILSEKNTLFESLIGKLTNYPELNAMLKALLFTGKNIVYNADNMAIDNATMFGFIKNQNGVVAIANRIFEMRLYNLYLSTSEMQNQDIYKY
ncbi:MAG: AAA-like domain-containing protein [bacterium]|nr:AAA-like domain-containing protein [bacterium]